MDWSLAVDAAKTRNRARAKEKTRDRARVFGNQAQRLRGSLSCSLEWRIGILDHSPVQFGDLRCLRNKGVIGTPYILCLDFNCLLKRLRSDNLLEGARSVFKSLLRVVRQPGGESLPTPVRLAVGTNGGIKAFASKSLKV